MNALRMMWYRLKVEGIKKLVVAAKHMEWLYESGRKQKHGQGIRDR